MPRDLVMGKLVDESRTRVAGAARLAYSAVGAPYAAVARRRWHVQPVPVLPVLARPATRGPPCPTTSARPPSPTRPRPCPAASSDPARTPTSDAAHRRRAPAGARRCCCVIGLVFLFTPAVAYAFGVRATEIENRRLTAFPSRVRRLGVLPAGSAPGPPTTCRCATAPSRPTRACPKACSASRRSTADRPRAAPAPARSRPQTGGEAAAERVFPRVIQGEDEWLFLGADVSGAVRAAAAARRDAGGHRPLRPDGAGGRQDLRLHGGAGQVDDEPRQDARGLRRRRLRSAGQAGVLGPDGERPAGRLRRPQAGAGPGAGGGRRQPVAPLRHALGAAGRPGVRAGGRGGAGPRGCGRPAASSRPGRCELQADLAAQLGTPRTDEVPGWRLERDGRRRHAGDAEHPGGDHHGRAAAHAADAGPGRLVHPELAELPVAVVRLRARRAARDRHRRPAGGRVGGRRVRHGGARDRRALGRGR